MCSPAWRGCAILDIDAFTIGLASPTTRRRSRDDGQRMGARHHVRQVCKDRISADFARLSGCSKSRSPTPSCRRRSRPRGLPGKVNVLIGGSDELFLGYPQCRTAEAPRVAAGLQRARLYLAVCCLMPTLRDLESMIAPEFLDRELLRDVAHQFDGYFEPSRFPLGAQMFELEKPLLANQLMRIDKLTMSFGLEARVPFLDNRSALWRFRARF